MHPTSLPTYGVIPPDPLSLAYISPAPSASSGTSPNRPNSTYTPPTAPIPLLPPSEFARMHLEHVTAHPPDSVLFPFLHGLEGDNEAQCTFFASSGAHAPAAAKDPYATAGMVQDPTGRVVRPPRYRGLVWVLCEDDLESPPAHVFCPTNDMREETDAGEGLYDTDSSDLSDDDGDVDMDASDHDDPARLDAMDVDALPHSSSSQNPEKHMHPVAPLHISTIDLDKTIAHVHTTTTTPFSFLASPSDDTTLDNDGQNGSKTALDITTLSHPQHDRRPSDASSGTTSESISTSSSFTSSVFTSNQESETTSATSFPSSPCLSASDGGGIRFAFPTSKPNSARHPPILTCSFFANHLIQPVSQANKCIVIPSRDNDDDDEGQGEDDLEDDVDWEFKPAKVPEGISLRNFGVQVPLYTSVSDVVIYSPRGASPAALRLAARFRRAIERKRKDRIGRWERGGEGKQQQQQHASKTADDTHDMASGFLKYGVYVLDADSERMERELGWMVMRKEEEGCGCCFGGYQRPHDPSGQLKSHHSQLPHHHPIAGQIQGRGVFPQFSGRRRCKRANTIDFAQREKDEMRNLTRASEIVSVFEEENKKNAHSQNRTLSSAYPQSSTSSSTSPRDPTGRYPSPHYQNSSNHPENNNTPLDSTTSPNHNHSNNRIIDDTDTTTTDDPSPFDSSPNLPSRGLGFDICIECHEYAPLPSSSHLRAAEEHVRALEEEWVGLWMRTYQAQAQSQTHNSDTPPSRSPLEIPPRPPPHPSAIIHLPFPSSPQGTVSGLNALIPVIRFLERVVTPGGLGGWLSPSGGGGGGGGASRDGVGANGRKARSCVPSTPSTPPKTPRYPHPPPTYRPRPLKVLLYSSDGYTESSVPALCLLMAVKGFSLPEAYLEMQVSKRRSFFVYQSEVGLLKRVEARLGVGNPPFRSRYSTSSYGHGDVPRGLSMRTNTQPVVPSQAQFSKEGAPPAASGCDSGACSGSGPGSGEASGKHLTLTIPASSSAPTSILSAAPQLNGTGGGGGIVARRPRASTLPTFIPDHQSWFDDARFDGSFPSRVLPFLYLGNLNHASNAYMLHALGITHVVSVGECALVPPPQTPNDSAAPQPTLSSPTSTTTAHFVAGQGPGGQGSLWIEEREGRIKVLDIKGVCDDGIDTLEPQLHPICTWIEKARLAGGQVLVHCRVGVSRSATVTIAYVMQYLGLSLVEAYLVVRSRRLSVLIQPNMRLLYNLLGWEVRLARERAGGDERRLREELGRALSWPYLAKEVHALNEKYLG
ncbi:hypothetical protein F5I97DRAFT_1937777 [Phlebopus sp. FC_14]|nr:hypothetical protein F5I97DRAFT_1937777 [Phlebopus sp. FC_14]